MSRTKPIPARAVLAGGITRHGPHCGCAYCAPDLTAQQRQAIPVIKPRDPDDDSLVSVEACS